MRRIPTIAMLMLIALPYGSAVGCKSMAQDSHEMHQASDEGGSSLADRTVDCGMQLQCRIGSALAALPLTREYSTAPTMGGVESEIPQQPDDPLREPRVPPPQIV